MKKVAAAMISILFTGCTVFGIRTVEQANYTVLMDEGDIQIRQYDDFIVAETIVEAEYDEASSTGFRRIAGYIFGKNKRDEKISMTAPVLQEREAGEKIAMTAPVLQEQDGTGWRMSFVMPAKYTLDTIPQPIDPKVVLKEVKGSKVAAIRYSGLLSEDRINKKTEKLEAWLEEKGYATLSEPRSAGYDPPWTIPFLRRNEVLIDIE
jgi:hypothetical protein